MEEVYYNKQEYKTFTPVFDWHQFYQKYSSETGQIFSFCQSKEYMKRLCAMHRINFDSLLETKISGSTSLKDIILNNTNKQGHNEFYKRKRQEESCNIL